MDLPEMDEAVGRQETELGADGSAAAPARREVHGFWSGGAGIIWGAATVSYLGDGLRLTAVPLLALSVTRSPLLIACVMFFERSPWLLLGTALGRIVARMDSAKVAVRANVLQGLISTGLTVSLFFASAGIPLLCLFVLSQACLEIAFVAAQNSLVVRHVPSDELESVNGRLQASQTFFLQLGGPPAAAALLSVSVPAVFFTDAATFAVAALLLFSLGRAHALRRAQPAVAGAKPATPERPEAVDSPWKDRRFRTLTFGIATVAAASGASEAILGLQIVNRLGATDFEYGLVFVGMGLSGVVAGLAAARLARRFGGSLLLAVTLFTAGASQLALSFSTSLWSTALVLTVQGGCVVLTNVAAASYRQRLGTPTMAAASAGAFGSAVMPALALGALAGGALASLVGLPLTFAICGFLITAVALVFIPLVTSQGSSSHA